MKLPVLARNVLRARLLVHPSISKHLEEGRSIKSLSKEELLAIARKLRINVRKLVSETMKNGQGLEAVWEEDELARFNYATTNPGFKGVVEFDITLEALGTKTTRKARI